jgi:hypothetical protein
MTGAQIDASDNCLMGSSLLGSAGLPKSLATFMHENTSESAGKFMIYDNWQSLSEDSADAIRQFWARESAVESDEEQERRLPEVVAHARDRDGRVAAVCTAYAAVNLKLGQPLYHYRCYVGAHWRTSILVMTLLRRASKQLSEYARAHGYPCIGVLVELENPRFKEALSNQPVWSSQGLTFFYAGKSKRGLDLRVHYFPGAELKRESNG